MTDRRPLGQKNYEEFAHRYAERLPTQPWNAYYERLKRFPAFLCVRATRAV